MKRIVLRMMLGNLADLADEYLERFDKEELNVMLAVVSQVHSVIDRELKQRLGKKDGKV